MPTKLSPQEFVNKWRRSQLKESSGSRQHFLDLCQLAEHGMPAEGDLTGERFCFEAGAAKTHGGRGWADVWKRGHFAWEYKGKGADLDRAYQQLLQYRESLMNPPLLVVSDMEQILIHTNFTNTVKQVITIELDDLLTREGLDDLKNVFHNPQTFRSPITPDQVTEEAAKEFARLADLLRQYGTEPDLAGRVDGHRGRDHRSHIRSTQRTTDFVISVLEHQRER